MSLAQSQDYGEVRGRKESSRTLFLPGVDLQCVCFLFSKIKWKSSCSKDSIMWQDITVSFSYSTPSICFICWCFRSTHDGSSLNLKDQSWTHRWHPIGVYSTPTPHAVLSRFCHKANVSSLRAAIRRNCFCQLPNGAGQPLHGQSICFLLGVVPDVSRVHCEACDRHALENSTVLWARW